MDSLSLKSWLYNIIIKSRERYQKLPKEYKEKIPNFEKYIAPIQVYAFWFQNPIIDYV